MKTYTLQKNKNAEHTLPHELKVTIGDLQALPTKTAHTYDELIKYLNYTFYTPDWAQPMEEEYEILYGRKGNKNVDFFQVKDTGLIVMPGTYLFPTALTMQDIDNMNR